MGYDFKVKVVSADGLQNKDGFLNKSDPYVEIYGCALRSGSGEPDWASSERVVTKSISGTLEPEWNEEFDLSVRAAEDTIYFRVFDHNYTKDKLMGTAVLSTGEFVSGNEAELKLQIVGTNFKKPDAGCLKVAVTAAFNGALANLTKEVDRMSAENDRDARSRGGWTRVLLLGHRVGRSPPPCRRFRGQQQAPRGRDQRARGHGADQSIQ